MNSPDHIIIHCSDSAWGDATEIAAWHRERGFRTIGYHFVILNGRRTAGSYDLIDDGWIERGRREDEAGAHAYGYNSRSIGVCLIGRGTYSAAQMASLHELVERLAVKHSVPVERILGHRETEAGRHKGCPLLDMDELRAAIAERLEVAA